MSGDSAAGFNGGGLGGGGFSSGGAPTSLKGTGPPGGQGGGTGDPGGSGEGNVPDPHDGPPKSGGGGRGERPNCPPGYRAKWIRDPGTHTGRWDCVPSGQGDGGANNRPPKPDCGGAESRWVDMPVEAGYPAGGFWECYGPAGGGGGDGGDGTSGQKTTGGPDISFIGPTAEELRLQGILADQAEAMGVRSELLFRLGLPAQIQAQQFFQDLLTSESTANVATGPAREQISQLYGGAGLGEGFLRGGQGRAAQADLTSNAASEISRLISGVQPQAAQILGSMGQQGTAAGQAGLAQSAAQFSDLLRNLNQNRQFENSFNVDVAALEEGARQFNLSLDQARWLSERNLSLQDRGLDLEAQRLSQQESQFLESIRIQQEQFDTQMQFARQQLQWTQQFQSRQQSFQESAAKGGMFGDLFGTLGQAAILGAFASSIKFKHMVDESVDPEVALAYVLDAAEKARASFVYKDDPTLQRIEGIILERAPRYGLHDALNISQIVGDLFAAVLVLKQRIDELERRG